MEKLFESVYRECHFSELVTFKAGKSLVIEWKDTFNDTWKRGITFIDDIKYNNGDKTVTFIFNKPVSLDTIKEHLLDAFPENKYKPFNKKPSIFELLDNGTKIVAFLSER